MKQIILNPGQLFDLPDSDCNVIIDALCFRYRHLRDLDYSEMSDDIKVVLISDAIETRKLFEQFADSLGIPEDRVRYCLERKINRKNTAYTN